MTVSCSSRRKHPRRSKVQLEGKLHRPGSALLVLRSHGSEACVQHFRRLSERSIGISGINVSEVGMIQNVECFSPKLQDEGVRQMELTPSGHVQLRLPESPNKIAGRRLSSTG